MSRRMDSHGKPRTPPHNDAESVVERKSRQVVRAATDGFANGVVKVLGPLDSDNQAEVQNIVKNITAREVSRNPDARLLDMGRDDQGLWIETESEKLAQHIADAIARARNMDIDVQYDEAAKQRVVVLHPKKS